MIDGTLEPLSDCLGSETGCTIRFEGSTCEHESSLIVAEVRKRKKIPSKELSDAFGPTPLSMEERISRKCLQLVIGTEAYGNQPVMEEVQREAEGRRSCSRLPGLSMCSMRTPTRAPFPSTAQQSSLI